MNSFPTLREAGLPMAAIRPRFAPVRNEGTLRNPGEDFLASLGLSLGPLGSKVTEITALGVSTVFACVHYIASIISTLPIDLFQKTPEGHKEIHDHPALTVLTIRPNPIMVSSDVRYAMAYNQALHGNGYAQLVFNRAQRPVEMWPLRARNVSMKMENGFPVYNVTGDLKNATVGFDRMLHLKGMTRDGIKGSGPMGLAANLIGLAQTLESNSSLFFKNGSRPGMVYTAPPGVTLTEAQAGVIQEQLNKAFGGVENAYKTMVVNGGGTVSMARSNNDASQFDEIAKRTHQQICQLFGVPPHKVQILDNATFSNIEQQQIQAVADLFRPWCVRWEEVFRGALLTPEEQRTYYFRHNLDAVLQADIKTRYEAHSSALQNGFRSINEVRRLENLNPVEGGDTHVRQLNLADINAPAPEPKPGPSADQVKRIAAILNEDKAAA